MRVLIYKRTHKGDPDDTGIFGIEDCMGGIRDWNYDAVIGIGGKKPWKKDLSIKFKVNWIGLGPKRIKSNGRANCVVFSKFALWEEDGLDIESNFPHLFNYMYGSRKRFDMARLLPEKVHNEVQMILKLAKNNNPSREYSKEEVHLDKDWNKHGKIHCSCGNKKYAR